VESDPGSTAFRPHPHMKQIALAVLGGKEVLHSDSGFRYRRWHLRGFRYRFGVSVERDEYSGLSRLSRIRGFEYETRGFQVFGSGF